MTSTFQLLAKIITQFSIIMNNMCHMEMLILNVWCLGGFTVDIGDKKICIRILREWIFARLITKTKME